MPWSAAVRSGEVVAIHAALVPTLDGDGEILLFGGDNHHDPADPVDHTTDHTARFNCRRADGTETIHVDAFSHVDVFCCGHAALGDGRILVAGGTESFPAEAPPPHAEHIHFSGHRHAFVYDPAAGTFTEAASMNTKPGATFGGGRWYPALCTLITGDVLAIGGHPEGVDDRHNNNIPERYEPVGDRWLRLVATGPTGTPPEIDLYVRVHVLRDGSVFVSSKLIGNERCVALDPWTGARRAVCDLPPAPEYQNFDCPALLLPLTPNDGFRERVLLCGGVTSFLLDFGASAPAWTPVPRHGSTAALGRKNACATILPTGDILMNGGASADDQTGRMTPELYSTPLDHAAPTPAYLVGTGSWQTLDEPATVLRNYHSTALLMPDGRVWTAGGNSPTQPPQAPGLAQKQIEIFTPPYPAGERPTIASCARVLEYDDIIFIGSPQARAIRAVTLMRCGSSTHAFNGDQRCIFLSFLAVDSNTLQVATPPDAAIAPPGNYMVFLVDDAGRPCQYASFARLGGRVVTTPEPFDKSVLDDSSGAGPALALHGGRLFLAWKGSGNPQLNLSFSRDGGRTFAGKKVLGDTSPNRPALISHRGELLLAWTGEGDGHLNVARVGLTEGPGGPAIGELDKVVLDDRSDRGPALAVHGGRLFLAWKGLGNPQLNLMFSRDGGRTFAGKKVLGDTSPHGPALIGHQGNLLLGWSGEGDEHLNVARVGLTEGPRGPAIGELDKVVLDDSSGEAPALALHGGRLFLAWKGSGNPQLNLMSSQDGGRTFAGKNVFADSTPHAPALVSRRGSLLLAWSGEGAEHLNVARTAVSLLSEIRWPEELVSADVGPSPPQFPPANALGPPDGTEFQCFPGMRATYGRFRGQLYPHLLQLLDHHNVTFGDAVTADDLDRVDVVAFERNGNAPDPGGGWESCDWSFADARTTVTVQWRSGDGAPRDRHVIANGSVRGASYKRYFGVVGGEPIGDTEVISFLLFTLPELLTSGPDFQISVAGTTEVPDIDVIGVLTSGR